MKGSVATLAALVLLAFSAQAQDYRNYDTTTPIVKLTAAGAGTTDSADILNLYARGAVVGVNISAKSGTIAVVVKIMGKDVVSGQYYDICDTASLTGTGLTTLTVYPGAVAVSNSVCNALLPTTWRIEVVSGTGSTPSVTMTVGAATVL